MLKYRKLTDLSDEEIKYALNDILHPRSIENIERDEELNCIFVDVETDWGVEGEHDYIIDTITLSNEMISVPWFDTGRDNYKWQQFLLAKGCNELLKDNPYLEVE